MSPRATGFLLLLLAIAGLAAQQPTPPTSTANTVQTQSPNQPTTTLTVKAHLVLLDVVVTDKHGHPVQGLKESDFQLSEDGVPQTLASFTEHDAVSTLATAPLPKLPPNTFTDHAPVTNGEAMTVLLFDELSFADAAYTRDQVAAFMKTVPSGTPICIFRLDWSGLRLVQDFTTDAEVLKEAVESKRNAQGVHHFQFAGSFDRRAAAMNELARYLSAFPGRKNLIWFSGGIPQVSVGDPGSPFPDISSFTDDMKGATDTLMLSRVALYPVDARGLVVDRRKGFEIMVEGGELSDLASSTGGKAFYNTNGIKQAVAEVVATGSNYYTLSYSPTNNLWNGNFRKLKIKLANNVSTYVASQASPLRLEYRGGYYARDNAPRVAPVSPSSEQSANARKLISYSPKGDPDGYGAAKRTPLQAAMAFGAVAPFQVLFKVHVTPDSDTGKIKRNMQLPQGNYLHTQWQHSPYRNYHIHYSIDPSDLQFESDRVGSYHDTIQFIAVVYDDTGEVVNSLISTAPLKGDPEGFGQIMQNGFGIDQTIAVPTHGDFFLRLGVHDLTSDRIGALEVPVETIKLLPPQTTP
jgi:VWFA-related protein